MLSPALQFTALAVMSGASSPHRSTTILLVGKHLKALLLLFFTILHQPIATQPNISVVAQVTAMSRHGQALCVSLLPKHQQPQGPRQARVTDKTLREDGHLLSLKYLVNKATLLWKYRHR